MVLLEKNKKGCITKDCLEDIIKHLVEYEYITDVKTFEDEYDYNRKYEFQILGKAGTYTIIWWSNRCYLYRNYKVLDGTVTCDSQTIFTSLRVRNTWPFHSKMQLQLLFKDEIISIIKLQDYERGS